jgi:hypothetical protein
MPTALVIISHYNAWPADQLIALLDQLHRVPSGHPFRCLVVVNRAVDESLRLPPRHSGVEVLYRENTGYNIGAWEHGRRAAAPADYYLFLQEECRVARPDWLGSYVRLASRPGVGLVGESFVWRGLSWDRIGYYLGDYYYEERPGDEPILTLFEGVTRFLEARGIPAADKGEHLQSLVLFARREVLEAIGGFAIGRFKGEAICSEVAISRAVVAKGYEVRLVGALPFRYFLHPQWSRPDHVAYTLAVNRVFRYTPMPILRVLRASVHALKRRLAGRVRPVGEIPSRPA